MRGIAARLRKQRHARRAGRRKLPQIPGDLPTTSSQGRVRRIATSLPQQGPIGRTRRRKLSEVSRDLQRPLVKGADSALQSGPASLGSVPAHRSSRRPLQLRPSFISDRCYVALWPLCDLAQQPPLRRVGRQADIGPRRSSVPLLTHADISGHMAASKKLAHKASYGAASPAL